MRRPLALAAGLALLASGCGDDAGGGPDAAPRPDADPNGPGWAALDDLPAGPIQETAVVALDGDIYVIGGIDDDRVTRDDVLVYDVDADAWSEAPSLPIPVHHVNAAVLDGAIHIVGALQSNFAPIGVVWSWRPGDLDWTDGTLMPEGTERGASAVGAVDDLIVVAGGLAGTSVALVSTYDPASGEWDDEPFDLPVRIDHGTGQTVDGVLYVIGGRTDGTSGNSDAVFAFVDGEWQERAPMPTARGGIGSGVVGGTIVVVGGEGNAGAPGGIFPQAEQYDPADDEWRALPDMRTPRHGMGAAAVGNSLYVPGGADIAGFGAVATHEVLRIP
jgi:N-acetylneuraminic acid mutarotase